MTPMKYGKIYTTRNVRYKTLNKNYACDTDLDGQATFYSGHTDWITYSGITVRNSKLCYFFFSNDLTPMVNFPT